MDNFIKETTGTVRQYFEKNKKGVFVCTAQEFITSDMCEYEYLDDDCVNITPPDYTYHPCNMAQLEDIKEVPAAIDAGKYKEGKMKTLAEYLIEYIDRKDGMNNILPDDISVIREWITEGIKAYEAAENEEVVKC